MLLPALGSVSMRDMKEWLLHRNIIFTKYVCVMESKLGLQWAAMVNTGFGNGDGG